MVFNDLILYFQNGAILEIEKDMKERPVLLVSRPICVKHFMRLNITNQLS